MRNSIAPRRAALLALSLLSACAANDLPVGTAGADNAPARAAAFAPRGAFGAYLAGQLAASETDTDFAAREFLRALRSDPSSPELLNRAFVAALMDGRPEAIELARQLPDNQAAQLLLAGADAKAGRWDSAEKRIRSLPRQGAMQLLHPILIAWVQQGRGGTDAALATLRPLVEGPRGRGVYALHAGLIAEQAGRTAEAQRLYHITEAEAGGANLRLTQIIASLKAREGHAEEAERQIRAMAAFGDDFALVTPGLVRTLSTPPVATATQGLAEGYLTFAGLLRSQDASDFALLLLRLALDLRPDYAPARLQMADLLENGEHYAAADAELARVSNSDPLAPAIRLRRAMLAERMGKSADARSILESLATDFPDRPEPLTRLGDLLRSQSRFPEAVKAYDRAVQRIDTPDRGDWPLFYARAIANEQSKDWPRAEADFLKALELSPDQPYVLNYLGYSWVEQGRNLSRARAMIEKAVELRPADGHIVDSLGWVLFRLGDMQGAIRNMERAVELSPRDATINDHLGDVYWAAGRKREAEFQWRRALNLNPEADDIPKIEAKLRGGPPGAAAAERASAVPPAQ